MHRLEATKQPGYERPDWVGCHHAVNLKSNGNKLSGPVVGYAFVVSEHSVFSGQIVLAVEWPFMAGSTQ
jgi:hypothetical protein